MTTISQLCDFLESFAPTGLAEDWDNVGLIVGRRSAIVERVMTCLTLTPDVAAEAIDGRFQLIVSHHPLLFRAIQKITDATSEGETLLQLTENGIAVYSPHTAFDSTRNGINQQLASGLQLQQIRPLRPWMDDPDAGSGRYGRLNEATPLRDFLQQVGQFVRADHLEYVGCLDHPVEIVAVACGAAESFLADAARAGCDTFVTGESRFHSALQARALGIHLILTGHFSSERPAVEELASILQATFPTLFVAASCEESNPLRLWSR